MAVPKSRHTKSKRGRRRSHLALKPISLANCPKCGKAILSHSLCWHCGYYKAREVINVLASLEKKERKKREREIKAQEVQEKQREKPLDWQELSRGT